MARLSSLFTLDSRELEETAGKRVRWWLGLSGVAAIIIGLLIVIWPGDSATTMALLLGIYFIVAGVAYFLMGIFTKGLKGWSRALDIILGLIMLAAGIIIILQPVESAIFLGLFLGIYLGIIWLVEGVVTIIQSGDEPSRGWAITFGIISILAGLVVMTSPLWSIVALFWFAGILLIVLGITQIVRAVRFGKTR
ncbi:MAG: DUF308 domain-containing protein [Propionibacteriaceae bacterium]|nr:DUF308 domain-containing protein [Propionibacteriaceae bacterium]